MFASDAIEASKRKKRNILKKHFHTFTIDMQHIVKRILSLSIFFMLITLLAYKCYALPSLNFYLGKPYLANPLGEGEKSPYAPMPLYRDDGFDCTTYVETVLANTGTNSESNNLHERMALLRYVDGKIDFFSRAHLMEYHWIPNAIKYKFIVPYELEQTIKTDFNLNLRQWYLNNKSVKNKDELYLRRAKLQTTNARAHIAYIPTKHINKAFIKKLPDFMVVFFIKRLPAKSWEGQNEEQSLITHMGLLKNEKLYHASKSNKNVVKVDLLDYLNSNQSFIGVSFYKVLQATP